MPAGNPLVEDMPGEVPTMFGAGAQATAAGATAAVSANIGPNAGGEHNTHLWVAGLMLFALAAIIFFHISGFRFATDVGITGR
jgi:hypothetical protein